jgi:hypothetical protein
MKDRRNFLGILGLGAAAAVVGNVSAVELNDKAPDDLINNPNDYIATRGVVDDQVDTDMLYMHSRQLSEIRCQREEIDDLRDELSRSIKVKDFMFEEVLYLKGELSRVTADWNVTRNMVLKQQKRAADYETQFKSYLIEAELWSAAVTCDAFMPEQVVNILREYSEVLDVLDADGKPTGDHQAVVNLHEWDYYYTGKTLVNQLPVLEAVQRFRFLCPGLFKAHVVDGIKRPNLINWDDTDSYGRAIIVQLRGIQTTMTVRAFQIEFISLPFTLLNEINSLQGFRWEVWIVDNCKENRDKLDSLT